MNSDVQREAIAALAQLWALSPDVRLGQLLAHLGFLGELHVGKGLGDIDDDALMAVMQRHGEELRTRLHGSPAVIDSSPNASVSGSSMHSDA